MTQEVKENQLSKLESLLILSKDIIPKYEYFAEKVGIKIIPKLTEFKNDDISIEIRTDIFFKELIDTHT